VFDSTIYLLSLVIALVAGLCSGYFLRNRKRANLGKFTFGVILTLIFSLGFSIGSNNALLNSLPHIGLNATVILLFVLAFSVLLVKVVKKLVKIE